MNEIEFLKQLRTFAKDNFDIDIEIENEDILDNVKVEKPKFSQELLDKNKHIMQAKSLKDLIDNFPPKF